MNALTDVVLNSFRGSAAGKPPLPPDVASRKAASSHSRWSCRLGGEAACSQGTRGSALHGEPEEPGLLSGGSRLPYKALLPLLLGLLWALPCPHLPCCWRGAAPEPWCPPALLGGPAGLGTGSCCSAAPCGAGLAVLCQPGSAFPLMWLKRFSKTAQEALIQPFPCSCKSLRPF